MASDEDVGVWRRVSSAMYLDRKYLSLSPVKPSGRSLWHHLIHGPHLGMIPGLSRIGRAAMAEELEWSLEGFDEAFREVFEQGMAKADWEARVVWLPNAIRHNPPANPNVVKGWRKFWSGIPECTLKAEAHETLKSVLSQRGSAFELAFVNACPNRLPNGSGNGSPRVSRKQRTESRDLYYPSQEGGVPPSLSGRVQGAPSRDDEEGPF